MVGAIYTKEKALNHWKDQVKLLAKDTQIRPQSPKIPFKSQRKYMKQMGIIFGWTQKEDK